MAGIGGARRSADSGVHQRTRLVHQNVDIHVSGMGSIYVRTHTTYVFVVRTLHRGSYTV